MARHVTGVLFLCVCPFLFSWCDFTFIYVMLLMVVQWLSACHSPCDGIDWMSCMILLCIVFSEFIVLVLGVFLYLWCFCNVYLILAVIALLIVVLCVRMYFLLFVVCAFIALEMFIVCVSAVFESEIIMHGCPGGVASNAMAIAMSSAMLLHVCVVPKAYGSVCICASSGLVFSFVHVWLGFWSVFCIAVMTIADEALCLFVRYGGLEVLYDASVAMISGD